MQTTDWKLSYKINKKKIFVSYTNTMPHDHKFRQNNILNLYRLYVSYDIVYELIYVMFLTS